MNNKHFSSEISGLKGIKIVICCVIQDKSLSRHRGTAEINKHDREHEYYSDLRSPLFSIAKRTDLILIVVGFKQ